MKPGRRRLLIPALLVGLLVTVIVSAAVHRADAAPTTVPIVPHQQVSVMDDPRITESSGLAASMTHPGIVYTVNDSGHDAQVFAVDIATGHTVGVTTVGQVQWQDTEAMALWGGKLWVADVGNNALSRHDAALYALDEPGRGNHRVKAVRYPIDFDGHQVDVEAVAFVPGRIDFFSKGVPVGVAFMLANPLRTDRSNVARMTGRTSPSFTTDATSTADGRYVLVRGPVTVEVHDATTWRVVHVDVVPALKSGETITMERSGASYLIGSEGTESPLIRVKFEPDRFRGPVAKVDPWRQLEAQRPVQTFVLTHKALIASLGGLVLAGMLGGGLAWRSKRRRRLG